MWGLETGSPGFQGVSSLPDSGLPSRQGSRGFSLILPQLAGPPWSKALTSLGLCRRQGIEGLVSGVTRADDSR